MKSIFLAAKRLAEKIAPFVEAIEKKTGFVPYFFFGVLASMPFAIAITIPVHELSHAAVGASTGAKITEIHLPSIWVPKKFDALGMTWIPLAKGSSPHVHIAEHGPGGKFGLRAVATAAAGPLSCVVVAVISALVLWFGFVKLAFFKGFAFGLAVFVSIPVFPDLQPTDTVKDGKQISSTDGWKIREAYRHNFTTPAEPLPEK